MKIALQGILFFEKWCTIFIVNVNYVFTVALYFGVLLWYIQMTKYAYIYSDLLVRDRTSPLWDWHSKTYQNVRDRFVDIVVDCKNVRVVSLSVNS